MFNLNLLIFKYNNACILLFDLNKNSNKLNILIDNYYL